MNHLTTETKITDTLAQLEEAFYDIPFENSDYQNQTFVVAAQLTPARAYRAIGLRMFAKIRAVKEALYGMQLADIDIEENEQKIASGHLSDFDVRRLKIEVAKSRDSRSWTEKLLNDALRELDCLYAEFVKHPRYTREEFEQQEIAHFQLRLQQQVQLPNGALESLANMQKNASELQQMLDDPMKIEQLILDARSQVKRLGTVNDAAVQK